MLFTDGETLEIKEIVKGLLKEDAFSWRKITDTPTDELQVVNKLYVDNQVNAIAGGSMNLLADVTNANNATTLASGTFLGRGVLKVFIFVNQTGSSASGLTLRFNGDTGNNYSYRVSSNSAAYSNTTAAAYIGLTPTVNTDEVWYELSIFNVASIFKSIVGAGYQAAAGGAGNPYDIKATWNNTSNAITSITVQDLGDNILAGSRIVVFGTPT